MGTTKVDSVAEAETLVVMKVVSGQNDDVQWFTYMPSHFAQPIRIEWDKGTMFVALPSDIASHLLSKGYARTMTEVEAEKYNATLELRGDKQ